VSLKAVLSYEESREDVRAPPPTKPGQG